MCAPYLIFFLSLLPLLCLFSYIHSFSPDIYSEQVFGWFKETFVASFEDCETKGLHACRPLLKLGKNTGRDFNICYLVLKHLVYNSQYVSSANRIPSVHAWYFHHTHLVSLQHAQMVMDEKIESKDLAWCRKRQDGKAGHFVSLGEGSQLGLHQLLCPLVSQVSAFSPCFKYLICGHPISYKEEDQY